MMPLRCSIDFFLDVVNESFYCICMALVELTRMKWMEWNAGWLENLLPLLLSREFPCRSEPK